MSKCCVAFHYESLTQRQADRESTEACAVPILTLALCQACSDRGRKRKGGGGVLRVCVDVCEGANIPLAGSPGPGGGQGSAGEGEAACPAVN